LRFETQTVAVQANGQQAENLRFTSLASSHESVTVTAAVSDVGVFEPDPAQRVMIRDETLDGEPGAPGDASLDSRYALSTLLRAV